MFADFSLDEWAVSKPWLVRAGFFLLGAANVLSFAPFDVFALAPFLLAPLFYAFLVLPPRQAARTGFCFGAGLFLAGTYWLYVSIHVFGQAPLILALLIMVALVLIMGVYYAAVGWLTARCRGNSRWQFLLVAPSAWVVVEWLRGWLMSGFPWMTLGYGQVDSPLAGIAPLLGVYGVSLLLAISSGGLLLTAISPGRQRFAYLCIALLPWFAGAMLANVPWTQSVGTSVRTTIVQGGVSQDRKWLAEQFEPTLNLYRNSLQENADSKLLIWPEVAIPSVLDQVEGYVAELETDLALREQTLLFGILERDANRERVYNSVVAVGGVERQIYRKRHLVPFGEYFPVPAFVREWMKLMNLPYSDISPGEDVQPLIQMLDGNRLSVAICYEDAYGTEQLYAMPDAGILINVSNDAWFGDSIAPHQHLQIARMRALEVGRHVVRATNNGISAFIGPGGELLQRGAQFEYVSMTRDVQPRTGMTPFARLGNWPVMLLTTLLMLLAGLRSTSQ